ncbi:MAG: 4Fe-4S dicluster domain-containing protein, partial [Candidatus Sericytochromatia bacterium]|nr:4Fe-4S dicluster domain-containing protein [Candidatus Tanganyikabacteria bacterium]
SLLVVLPKDHAAARKHEIPLSVHLRRGLSACENCSQCTQLCPANLVGQPVEPHKVMRAVAHGLDGMAEAIASAAFCVGCGLCTAYACPVGLAPSIVTLAVKRKLTEGGYVTPLGTGSGETKAEWADRRVPLERLLTRLDLARYDVPAPIAGAVAADRVVVPIELPSGLLAAPTVRDGHRVKAGQKIADVPDNAPGVPILASLTGSVRLTPQGIEITA